MSEMPFLTGRNAMELLVGLFDLPTKDLVSIAVEASIDGPARITCTYLAKRTGQVNSLHRDILSFRNDLHGR